MLTSQNGFSANDRSVIASFTIPRTQQKISLRKGDTSVILLDLLGWLHLNIEPLDVGIYDDWGYAERTIRGSSKTLSNHASGTAVDANATQHPLGVTGTWTADEKRRIDARLALYEGCIRWGENYTGRLDGMHFEVNRGAADCKRVADKIRAGQLDASPTEGDLFMALSDAEQREILDGIRRMKPGIVLPARSPHCSPKQDDYIGSALNAWAEAANTRAGVDALHAKLDQLIGLVKAAGVDPAAVTAAVADALGGGLTITGEITGSAVPKRVA